MLRILRTVQTEVRTYEYLFFSTKGGRTYFFIRLSFLHMTPITYYPLMAGNVKTIRYPYECTNDLYVYVQLGIYNILTGTLYSTSSIYFSP